MIRRHHAHRLGIVALLAIAMLVTVQPLGVFWHFVHNHLAEHSHAAGGGVAIHVEDVDAAHHDADHIHVWTMPAAAVAAPRVRQPQVIAALTPSGDITRPSADAFPPFPPPRA